MHGLQFTAGVVVKPSKAGARLLAALDTTARRLKRDLTITCGAEGHPDTDPHTTGEAFDVRTHDVRDEDKLLLLRALILELVDPGNPMDAPIAASGGLGTLHFWGWIEKPGEPAEHLHVQRRHGTVYV